MFEAVPPLAVNHADAVEGADDEQGPGDADAHGGQHPRHITRLSRKHRRQSGAESSTRLIQAIFLILPTDENREYSRLHPKHHSVREQRKLTC